MQAEVHSLRRLHQDYFLQRFTAPPLVFQPGQFVMVKPSGSLDPFLPRAYSILRVRRHMKGSGGKGGNVVEILYKVMGTGTTALSHLKPGDRVNLLGPLGNGYRVPPNLTAALLVAGGIGVPPVVALAERLASQGFTSHGSRTSARSSAEAHSKPSVEPFTVHGSQDKKVGRRSSDPGHRSSDFGELSRAVIGRRKIVAFVGGQTSTDVLCLSDLRKAGATLHVATEDGSLGHQGLVTDLLETYFRSSVIGLRSAIYACGPHPMLHAVAQVAERFEIPCQVSLEAYMACGFGACMACVIPVQSSETSARPSTELGRMSSVEPLRVQSSRQAMNREPSTMNRRSYKLCCKDGPAFDAREISW